VRLPHDPHALRWGAASATSTIEPMEADRTAAC
jgi:hypothetical protein